jgi:hypothetical protein
MQYSPVTARSASPSAARCTVLALALGAMGAAQAADFNAIGALNQAEFRAFSEDVAAAVSYKGIMPTEGLGITGFDVGVAAFGTQVAHRDVLRKAAGGASIPSYLPTTALKAVKGLPLDIDIGVTVSTLPGTNIRATGGELRWAFVGGGTVLPAVGVRLAVSNLSGVDQLKLRTTSADISISKGFTFLTPYAGVGTVRSKSSAPGTTLAAENFSQSKVFGGVNMALGLMSLAIEADKTGDAAGYGVKLAMRF